MFNVSAKFFFRTSRINPMDDLAFAIAQVSRLCVHVCVCTLVCIVHIAVVYIYELVDSHSVWFIPIPILNSQDPETADLIRKLDIKKNVAVKGT